VGRCNPTETGHLFQLQVTCLLEVLKSTKSDKDLWWLLGQGITE
jgi:hypothetical protein